jgi:hypothetical protein
MERKSQTSWRQLEDGWTTRILASVVIAGSAEAGMMLT